MSHQAEEPVQFEMPCAVDAERVLLGAVLLEENGTTVWDQVARLWPADWYLESHRRIRRAMGGLRKADPPSQITIVTLANELARRNEVEAVGGIAYLASLTEGLPRRPEVSDYIRIVKEKARQRHIIETCQRAVQEAADPSAQSFEIAAELRRKLDEGLEEGPAADTAKIENFIVDALQEINLEYTSRNSPSIPSGNPWFDHKAGGGYRHGKITIVAARPKCGKTSWLVDSAVYNLKRGRKVVLFSLEMEKVEILKAMVPHVDSGLSNLTVSRAYLQTPEQNQRVNLAIAQMADWPLVIYDGDMDIDEVCWAIERETRDGEEVLFGLDHFGLLDGPGKDIRTRYVHNSNMLRKKMKHKKAALVNLLQLQKPNRDYANKPPMPSEVKESGNPGEDCYAMLLLHRYYEENSLRMSMRADLNLAYIRGGGSSGNIEATFNTRTLSFEAEPELDYDRTESDY